MHIFFPIKPNTIKLLQGLSLILLLTISGFSLATIVNIGDVVSDSIDTEFEIDEFEFSASSGDTVLDLSSTAINLDETIEGEIATQGEEDEFTFTLATPQTLYFDKLTGPVGTVWTLTDTKGVETFSSNFTDVQALVLPAGDYRLNIDALTDRTFSYSFIIVTVPPVSRTPINLNEVVTGEIAVQGEMDEFLISLDTTKSLFFDQQVGSRTSISWTLLNENEQEIFSHSIWADAEDLVLGAGEYILRIDGVNERTLEYQFQIVEIPPVSLTEINLDEVILTSLSVQGEKDDFTFSVATAQEVYFDRQLGSTNALNWSLNTSEGEEIFNDPSWGDIEPIILAAGNYVLKVDGVGDRRLDYQFQLHIVPETTTTEAELYLGTVGELTVPGQRLRFEYHISEPTLLAIERIGGRSGSVFKWEIFDANNSVLASNNSFASLTADRLINIVNPGIYTLKFDGHGDNIGKFILRMWPVEQPESTTIALDSVHSLRLSSQGQAHEYLFEAIEGEPLYLNVDYRNAPRLWFNLFAPDGRRLNFNSTDDATITSLSQTGTYKLVASNSTNFGSVPTGNHSFSLSQTNDDFIIQNAAELQITSASANYAVSDELAIIEISYTVTNNGSVVTNVGAWKDQIQFFTDNEFRLTDGDVLAPFDFTIPIEFEHEGALAPGENYVNSFSINYPLLDQTGESFEIVIDADVENQVYEATSDLNQHRITPLVLLYDERTTAGNGAITTNLLDGSILPSNRPIVLSGNANLSGGSVNVYFVVDNSASTSNPFGFDANGDGTVDEQDNFNGDGSNGDVLDVEISAIIKIANQVQQSADDAFVSVIPFNGTASLLDLGPERLMQSFIRPNEQSFSPTETNLAYALKNNVPRLFGTNFAAAISELLNLASIAPDADQNIVFFLTDGQAFDTVNPEELHALGELGITLFAFQINNNTISSSLQVIVDKINNHPNSTATGQSVVNPGDLPNLILQSFALESVEINGIEADVIDAAGNYFSTITLNEGQNEFTVAALDNERNGIEKRITLFGAASDGASTSTLVPSQGKLIYSHAFFNRSTKRLFVDAQLQNNGALPIVNPITINLQIDPVAVNLDNADGHTINGQAILLFDDELGTGVSTGNTSVAKNTIFSNQRRDRFSVQSQLLTIANKAPYFASTPPITVGDGGNYVYAADAIDDDGDTLSYSLHLAPLGMSINAQSGQIMWHPASTQTGTHFVSLKVIDGNGGVAEQEYQLSVTNSVANLPPFIMSTPELSIISAQGYQYQLVAVDPEAGALSYLLEIAPHGVIINASTGLLSAAPDIIDSGDFEFLVTVVDTQGGQAQQSWISTVKDENQSPIIISNPIETISADTLYTYRLQVDDDDVALRFELTSAPLGMSINSATGAISMRPTSAQIGSHNVSVRVTDPFGATAVQNYSLLIVQDAEPPKASIILSATQIALGESIIATIVASDNAGIADISFVFDGTEQVLDNTNSAIIAPNKAGQFSLIVTVTDINSLVTQETAILRVIDTEDLTAPIVSILSPGPRSTASFLTDIVGSVEANDLLSYKLQHTLASEFDITAIADDGPQWTTFSQGNEEVSAALLGVFDSSILRNDDYVVRLYAEDINGNISAAAIYIGVFGEAKTGVFQLTYTDLAIAVSNIPIEINRIYRTTDASVDGDLGYGWHLQFSNPDIRETVPIADMEEVLGLFVNNAYTTSTRVYLNAPDGKRIGFTFEPEPRSTLIGNGFTPKFIPDPGVFYELQVDPVTITQKQDGSYTLFLVPFNYNPQNFRLIEPDGTRWQYNQFSGLEKVSDRNGNELVFTKDGIFHSSGISVTFERDDEGRITGITDPQGNQLSYHFNANGELTTFTDLTGDTDTFAYFDTPQHFMSQITDVNGNVTSIEFDQNGRLSASLNELGERISQDWDPIGFTGTITDAKGQITQLQYDTFGNIISEQDPSGGKVLYRYDNDYNLLNVVDKNGNMTAYTYDDLGNVKSEIDALGNTTQYGFDKYNNRTSITNALGSQITSSYDENGNLSQVSMPNGSRIEFTYDEAGRVLSMTDAEGNQTTFEYSGSFVTPVRVTSADGHTQVKALNNIGLVTTLSDELGNSVEITRDAKGRILEQKDASNYKYIYEYTGNLLSSITDPSGKSKYFTYDAKEQLNSTIFDNGTKISYSYDANGNLTSVSDVVGNTTIYTSDSLDRMISRTDATGATETYQYDNEGNLTQKIDRRSYMVNYEYDAINRMLLETWLDDADAVVWQMIKTYDAVDNVLSMDDGFSEIANTYDANNRIVTQNVSIASGPASALTFAYDGNDQLIEVSDASSMQSLSYNSRNLVDGISLTADTLALSAELSYDPRGLRATMTRKLNNSDLGTSTYVFNSRHLAETINHELVTLTYEFDYVWDENRRVSSQTQNSELINYVYNNSDQISEANRSQLANELYGFDENGNPTLDANTGTANRLLSAGSIDYTYDTAGNMIGRTDSNSGERAEFAYDHRNRVVGIQLFDSSNALLSDISYGYDPLDRRVKRRVNDQDEYTNYVFEDAWTDMQADGNVVRRYLNGANTDEKVARIVNGIASWYLTDKQQTIYSIVDSNGNAINEFEYNSFGKVISETNSLDADRFAYTGRELNREVGIYDYRARTYDPSAKRFYSEDPLEYNANDANLYRYVFNNPLQGSDPSGKSAITEYGQLLCNIVLPQVAQYKVLGDALEEMYVAIAEAVESGTPNDGIVSNFAENIVSGMLNNAVGAAGSHANALGGAAGGAYNSMFPPGGNPDGSDSSPGDAGLAIACSGF